MEGHLPSGSPEPEAERRRKQRRKKQKCSVLAEVKIREEYVVKTEIGKAANSDFQANATCLCEHHNVMECAPAAAEGKELANSEHSQKRRDPDRETAHSRAGWARKGKEIQGNHTLEFLRLYLVA